MKKIYALLITFLISVACTLSACGNPYQKMKMELITDSNIEIQLTENVEVNTPEGELDPNTAEVKVKISGVGEKISKEAMFTSSDTSKLYVKSTKLDGDTTTAEIIAKKPGNVELYVNSKEGGKKLTVKVSIVRKVSALSFEKDYKPAVIIGGTPTKIDVTKLVFTPSDANVRDVEFSLAEDVAGASIDGEGNLSVTEATTETIRVRVSPKFKESAEVYAEVDVAVLPNVNVEQVAFYGAFNEGQQPLDNALQWVKNDPTKALFAVSFDYNIETVKDLLAIRVVPSDTRYLTEKESARTNTQVVLSPIDAGVTSAVFEVYYKGYEEIVVASYKVDFTIIDAVTEIVSSGENNEITIYNASRTSMDRGTEFIVTLKPNSASNQKYKMVIGEEIRNHLNIVDSLGGAVGNAQGEIESGTRMFISHDGTLSNETFTFDIVPVGETLCEPLTIKVNCLTAVENVTAAQSVMLWYSESYGWGTDAELTFTVEPAGARKSTVEVISNNPDVVQVVYDQETETHRIYALKTGYATLSYVSNGNSYGQTAVEVVAPFEDFVTTIASPKDDAQVIEREMVDYSINGDTVIGQTVKSAVIVAGRNVKVGVSCYPSLSRTKSVKYEITEVTGANAGLVSISKEGYLTTQTVVKSFKVVVMVVGFSYSAETGNIIETDEMKKEIEFTSIIPIESVSLSSSTVILTDINTLGISEIEKSQAIVSASIVPSNSTINKQDIVWSVKEAQYKDIIERLENGSVRVTGKLNLADGDSRTVTLIASVTEYSRTFTVECLVTIKRAKTVENILLENYDNLRGVYLKGTSISGTASRDSYQIRATAMPADVANRTLIYHAFDITQTGGGDNWFTDEANYSRSESTLIDVTESGLITPKSGLGGYAVVWVIPADNIKSETINYDQITKKRVILVRVADGTVDAPYEIESYVDLLNISQAMDKAYVLAQSIDLSSIDDFTPIGSVENPFTGRLSGKYITNDGKTIINGITNLKLNANGTADGCYGLFACLGTKDKGLLEGATIENLTVSVIASNFNVALGANEVSNFGFVAGVNNGTISNVKVKFNGNFVVKATKNDTQSALGTALVGGISGTNYGIIENSGSITYGAYGIVVDDETTATVKVGGVCGENRKNIFGQFVFVGDLLTPSSSETNYNVDYNDETVNSSIRFENSTQNAIIGGISAVNFASIEGAYSKATIVSPQYVGGISAINYGSIVSVRFTGFIKANKFAGGIVGENTKLFSSAVAGSITFGIVEICDDKVHFENYDDSVFINYGGVVGANAEGTIKYSFINSYSAQRENDNENADFAILASSISQFGAFAGRNDGTIAKSFANVQLNTNSQHIFVGSNNGTISSCYSLSYAGEFTSTNQTMYSENADDFTTKSGINFGKKIIKIDATEESDRGELLLTQSPTSLQARVLGELNKANRGRMGDGNRYYKNSDTQLVLFYNSGVNATTSNNVYYLKDMFSIVVSPNTSRNKNVIVKVIEGQNVLKVEGASMTTLGQGRAVLRFASDLDESVFCDVEVFVVYGITNIDVDNIEKRVENNQVYKELKIAFDGTFDFKISNYNIETNNDVENQYKALASGGYLFSFNEANIVTFDRFEVNNEKSFFVRYDASQIMTALSAVTTSARIYPYISAQFSNGTEIVETKVVLSDIYYDFDLVIYEGLSNFNLQSASEEIMPDTTLNYDVTLTTDQENDVIDFVKIYNGSKFDADGNVKDCEEYDLSQSVLHKEVSQNTKFAMEILKTQFDETHNTKKFTFEISPSTHVDGNFAILQRETFTLEFGVTYANGTKATKTFTLTLVPQTLSNILANHYNDGADFDANLTGAGEEVSSKIIPGQYGLLIVNLYPDYSTFDRLEITSSTVQNDSITFEQVYYNIDANNYDTKVENTQIITNGISVKRQSTKRLKEDGNFEYAFDGRIFLRTVTGSAITTGQVFTITISAFKEGASAPYITKTIELTALQAPYLTFDLTNGRTYKSLAHEYFVANQVNNEFTVVTDSVVNETSGISSKITDASGAIVTGVSLVKTGSTIVSGERQTIKYVIIANSAFEKGKTYNVELVVERTINGVKTKSRIVNKLHVVDFLVTGFDIVDSETDEILVSNGTLSRPLSTEGWLIKIKLKTICSAENQANVLRIEDQLNGRQTLYNGRYYNPWKYKVLSGMGVGQFATIDNDSVSQNFTLTNAGDGKGYHLVGRNIANVDTLMADFSYYYNEQGTFTLPASDLISLDGNPSTQFRLDFSLSSSADHPLPITTKEEFLAMEEGIDYILLSDINLGYNYVPLNTKISSLDGNGYTIEIESFSTETDDKNSTTINLGLFGSVDSSTILKNLTVRLSHKMTYNLESYSTINFGVIAGTNAGIITNACVNQKVDQTSELLGQIVLTQSSSESSTISANIAGLVGTNTGTITNSRVEYLNLTSSGNVAGLTAQNAGIISSSYVLEPVIESTSGNTGGFVAVNGGAINTSYVRGKYVNDSLRARDGLINAVGQVGGFVYLNSGSINDSYANIKISSQSRSAGFVYENANNGTIYNCLSLSDIIQNSIAHMPFVGTDTSDRFLNNGTLTNAYYYRWNDSKGNADRFVDYDRDGNKNPAQVMTAEDLQTTTSLAGFAFSSSDSEFSGVWVQPTISVASYFNGEKTFGAVGTVAGFDKLAFKVGVPELVAPNVIARSVRRIDSIETNEVTGESIYNYVYVTQSNANFATNEKYGCALGTIHNQALISSAQDFVNTYEVEQNGQLVTTSKMNARLIKSIDFSTYEENLRTPKVSLSAIVEGNGLSMANISVVSNVDEKAERFGLFKNIIGDTNSLTNNISAIKNIDFAFIEVKSASSNIVGSVAGSMTNANLIDVSVVGNQVAVKGANIVGGIVGLVDGNSKLFHVSSNISVNSGYRNSGNEYYEINEETSVNTKNALYTNDSMFYGVDDLIENKTIKNTLEYVSYAGAVAGVVDTKSDETIMECYLAPNVYDITVSGDVKVIGATAGGVFGMVGLYTFVSNIDFEISGSSYISGDDYAGGIIGELRGKMSQAKIAHTKQNEIDKLSFGATSDDINLDFFKKNTTTKASGGLVGFNFGGTILDSISHAYVRNPYSNLSGGAVGATISGDIKAVVATGSVVGRTSVGGLIGGIISTYVPSGSSTFYNEGLLPLYFDKDMNIDCTLNFKSVTSGETIIQKDQNSMVLSYVMAGNNWTSADQTTLSSIKNWGGMIGNYDTNLPRTYINTTHPKDKESRVNLINFYVAGRNDTNLLSTRGNEDENDEWMHIAEPIPFTSLTYENKQQYFGSYYRFVWDLTNDSKYPEIDIKAVPDTITIESASDLLQIIWNLSANYLIVDDIDLSGIDSWLPLGTEKEPFSGTLRSEVKVNGGSYQTKNTYYKIENLKIVASNIQNVGLFGVTGYNYKTKSGATFENLVITVDEIVGKDFGSNSAYIGALVANARGATIKNVVTTKATKNSMIVSSSEFAGGIVGVMENLLVDDDESEVTNAKRIITSSISDSLSSLDIGILKRETSVAGGKTAKVGGIVGQINAGEVVRTASNQKIGLCKQSNNELDGSIEYTMLDSKTNYNGEYYNMSIYVGGIVGTNGSQILTTHEGSSAQKIELKQSFSNTSIEVPVLNLYSENKIDTVLGGFLGRIEQFKESENGEEQILEISNCYSSGSITVNGKNTGETVANDIVISGFAGQIVVPQVTSGATVVKDCYSLTTLTDKSNTSTIKGFGQILGYADSTLVDITNDSNAKSIASECVYEHYYALVVDYDSYFGMSSAGIIEKFKNDKNFKIDPSLYYPVLGVDVYALGINDRTQDFAVYGTKVGSKINPIQLAQSQDLLNITDFAKGSEEYNYYLVTGNVDEIPTHVYDTQGKVISNNSPMISEFYGFLNGNGFSISGFTVKESPKVFDEEFNVIDDPVDTENVGLFRILKDGSCISGLSLKNVYIDFQSSSTVNNSTMNVAGLVGAMESGSVIFASTVSGEIFAKGAQYYENIDEVKTLVSRGQTLNIGGLAGDVKGGSIINSANYARIASFDYKAFKNAGGTTTESLKTLNIGGLAGKITSNASMLNIFSISQVNYDDTNSQQINVGQIAGYAKDSTIKNYYGKVEVVKQEYTNSVHLENNVGDDVTSVEGRTTNIITNELIQDLDSATEAELATNYGYEYNPILSENVPKTRVNELVNGAVVSYYIPANTETLMNLMKGNYNIKLENDIYIDSSSAFMKGEDGETVPAHNVTVDSYSSILDGGYNAIYGVKGVFALDFGGSIINTAFSGTNDYNGTSSNIIKTMQTGSKVSVVDLSVTSNNLGLAKILNSNVEIGDLNIDTSAKNKLNSELWMNMSVTNDESEERLRAFVEYWDDLDVRGVYLEKNEATKTVLVKDEDGNEVASQVKEWRNNIKDSYQLSKYAKLVNDGDVFELKVTELDHTSVFDLSGKIWHSLQTFEDSILSTSENLNEKAKIQNMYVEGTNNLGFIGTFNSTEGKLFNLEFTNAKMVNTTATSETTRFENIGVVVGNFTNGSASDISVKGIVNIGVPKANYVGVAFGKAYGEIKNISTVASSEDVTKSKVKGLDFVGGIAGTLMLPSKTASNIDNNFNISGRDFVGGLIGYSTGSNNPNIYFYEKVVNDGVATKVFHKNSGTVQGRNFVGGIVGYNDAVTLNLPTNEGSVEAIGYAVGGIAGYTSAHTLSAENGETSNRVAVNNLITVDTQTEQTDLAKTLSEGFAESALLGATYSNSTLNSGYFYGGIVGYLNGADIRADISNGDSNSRKNQNNATIDAVSFVGGIVGYNKAGSLYAKNVYLESVDNSTLGLRNYASVIGKTFVGGIAGVSVNIDDKIATVKDAVAIANGGLRISGEYCVGGIVGANYGYVWSVATAGQMFGQTANFGGIVGFNGSGAEVQYANSGMIMTISATDGSMSTTNGIKFSNVGANYYVGGVVGHNLGSVKKSTYSKGDNVAADSGTIKFAVDSNLTNVQMQNIYIGGLIGVNEGSLDEAYTDAGTTIVQSTYEGVTLSGSIHIAGLVGLNKANATISDCYSLAKIINRYNKKLQGGYEDTEIAVVDSEVAGGLVYENLGEIKSCYATYCLYAKNSGTISNDCYVMELKTISKTIKQVNEDGETVSTKVSVENYTVKDDSDNLDNYYRFVMTKFTLVDVEIAGVSFDGAKKDMTYDAQNVRLKFESTDGKYSDTDWLVNINSIKVTKSLAYFDSDVFKCDCEFGKCDCKDRKCCNDLSGACYCIVGIGVRYSTCVHKHKKLWLENFGVESSSKASVINEFARLMLRDVVFNLAFTGQTTPTNYNTQGNVGTVSPSVANMPTTGFMGDGSISNPFRIYSVDDLDTLNRQLEFGNSFVGKTFKLMRDINLDGASLTISNGDYPFQGVFDGNGKTIKGNVLNSGTDDNVGLFQVLASGGQIKSLILVDCTSNGNNNVGLVVGKNLGTIKDVQIYASGTSYSKVQGNENVGAICGLNLGSVDGCSVAAEVKGSKNVGIVVGTNSNGRVSACETIKTRIESGSTTIDNHSYVTGADNVGGIVGYNTGIGSIAECSNEGEVNTNGYGGGIVGLSDAKAINSENHSISDVINRGPLTGSGKRGQLAGKIAEPAYNVLVTSVGVALGEASSSVQNCYVVDGSNSALYQNNAFKTEVYKDFNFDSVWGMSPTELDISTNKYSYPLVKSGDDNYPKLRNLRSSKELVAIEGGYFVNQYFNVNSYTSKTPTLYIESQHQFDIFINYFLGELIAQDFYHPLSSGESRYDEKLWLSIKTNSQYTSSGVTYKLYKTALNNMSATNKPNTYNDEQSYGDWVALPEIKNKNIDFSGIKIKINNFNNMYRANNTEGWTTAGFISSFEGESYNSKGEIIHSDYTISNLNLTFKSATGGVYFGGIVGYLGNANIKNCTVKYEGTGEIKYEGSYSASTYGGPIAGFIKEKAENENTYGKISGCSYEGFSDSTFVGYNTVNFTTNS